MYVLRGPLPKSLQQAGMTGNPYRGLEDSSGLAPALLSHLLLHPQAPHSGHTARSLTPPRWLSPQGLGTCCSRSVECSSPETFRPISGQALQQVVRSEKGLPWTSMKSRPRALSVPLARWVFHMVITTLIAPEVALSCRLSPATPPLASAKPKEGKRTWLSLPPLPSLQGLADGGAHPRVTE